MGGRIAHAPFDIRAPRARRLDTSPDAMLVMTDVPAALARTPRRRRDDVAGGPRARESARPGLDRGILGQRRRSEEHTSELQSRQYLVCRLLLEKKKNERPKKSKRATTTCCRSVRHHTG